MARKVLCGVVLAILFPWPRTAGAELVRPEAVSPGSRKRLETVGQSCPTFSWGAVPGAAAYEVAVYEVTESGVLGAVVIRHRLAVGVSSWTPSLRQCLASGLRYAWAVGMVPRKGETRWSEPVLFRVAAAPSDVEFQQALAVVERYFSERRETWAGDSRATSSSPSHSRPATPAGALGGTDFSVDGSGNVEGLSFTGDGSGLTNLAPGNLAAGTAGIDVTGTASNVTGTVAVDHGGTGASTAGGALTNLGAASQVSLAAHTVSSDHDSRYYTETELQTSGSSSVHWDNLASYPTTTKGDLLVEDGADLVRIGIGTDGQVLVADSGSATGISWQSAAIPCPEAPALVPRTGQTNSYGFRDDGDLERGVPWPDPRFTDNLDGTATDNLTGLIWLKDATCLGPALWIDALADANTLADPDCGLSDGSMANDWRLPNQRELMSLLDYGTTAPPLPPGHPFTVNVNGPYWSSTTQDAYPDTAWTLLLHFGSANIYQKTDTQGVWPVRGGQ